MHLGLARVGLCFGLALLAVTNHFAAIKYIANPAREVQRKAVSQNAEAVLYLKDLSEEDKLFLVEENIDVVKYLKDVDKGAVENILKIIVNREEPDREYIIKFIKCEALPINKVKFIYSYGSLEAKKILVDYKLSI
jgi:hypothetical protein